jgi:hypothetical protein
MKKASLEPAIEAVTSPVILAQSGVPASVTGTTAETVLASITIPGGMIGANGSLRVTAAWSHTNSANTKRPIVKLGSTAFTSVPVTNSTSSQTMTVIRNRGATNSQVSAGSAVFGIGGTSNAAVTSAIDTTVDQVLSIRGQLTIGDGSESITLEGYTVEVLPG